MVVHVITQGLDISQRELIVADLGFLQANHVRLVLFDQRRQLVRARAQAVDVERDDLHEKTILTKIGMLSDIRPSCQHGTFRPALLMYRRHDVWHGACSATSR